jgi:drug/metabolite transporter (DMT)-like permease
MNKDKVINWTIFILLSFIWGSSFILMKESSKALDGWQIASIRIFSAGLIFLPFAVIHINQVPRNKIGIIILSALLGNLFPAFLFAIAIYQHVDSALAGILNSLTPLLVIVLGILFYKSEVKAKKMAGVLIGLAGLLILSVSKGGINLANFRPAMLILLATLCYGFNVNMVGHYLKGVKPFKMATVSLAFMLIPTSFFIWQLNIIPLLVNNDTARWPIIASALLGVIGSAIATALFYVLIKRAGGLFASLCTYGIPVVAIFWGLWANENVTGMQVGCLALILSGVYLANRS